MSHRKFKRGISLLYHGCYRSNNGINLYIYIQRIQLKEQIVLLQLIG